MTDIKKGKNKIGIIEKGILELELLKIEEEMEKIENEY